MTPCRHWVGVVRADFGLRATEAIDEIGICAIVRVERHSGRRVDEVQAIVVERHGYIDRLIVGIRAIRFFPGLSYFVSQSR